MLIKKNMADRIRQGKVAHIGRFFKNGFLNRWGLTDYINTSEPCIFWGLTTDEEIEQLRRHKGLKVLYLINAYCYKITDKLVGIDDLVIIDNPYIDKPERFNIKNGVEFQYKDYSTFKPNILGDTIYCYIGNESAKERYGYYTALELQKLLKWEIIFGNHDDPNKLKFLSDYNRCFLNLNLEKSGGGGRTTMFELAYMGRKSIFNTLHDYPCLIKYNDMDDLIRIIEEEANKIGTIQEAIECHNTWDEWLNIDFWK